MDRKYITDCSYFHLYEFETSKQIPQDGCCFSGHSCAADWLYNWAFNHNRVPHFIRNYRNTTNHVKYIIA